MFGYVRPSLGRLSQEEKDAFARVYCGLCWTLRERCGTTARFILNYDFAFLAILLWEGELPPPQHSGCIAHPIRGRSHFPRNAALDLAADCSVILAWWQLQDGITDHTDGKKLRYRAAAAALSSAYRRAAGYRPAFDCSTREQLERLRQLELSRCASLDEPADTFAALLRGIAAEVDEPVKRRVLEQLLYHLGRWIYLVDAADDLPQDVQNNTYNPLVARFALSDGKLTTEARKALVVSLDGSIQRMAAAGELYDFGAWRGLLNATFYEGLYGVGRAVLDGKFHAKEGLRLGNKKEQI